MSVSSWHTAGKGPHEAVSRFLKDKDKIQKSLLPLGKALGRPLINFFPIIFYHGKIYIATISLILKCMVVALSTFRLLCNHHHHHFQNSLHPAKLKLYAHHSGTSILLPSSPAACILLAVSVDLLLEVSHGGSHTQSVSL